MTIVSTIPSEKTGLPFRSLCVIPARGGSKRLPRKNILPLAGQPLLSYAVDAAVRSRVFDTVLLSTEDAEIAEAARELGCPVLDRPRELASDEASTLSVLLHAVEDERTKGREYDYVWTIPPTAPLRNADDVMRCADILKADRAPFLIAVTCAEPPPWIGLTITEGRLVPVLDDVYFKMRRQDMPPSYCPNGSIYAGFIPMLESGVYYYQDRTLPYAMPEERSVNIDTHVDFLLGELLLRELQGEAAPR